MKKKFVIPVIAIIPILFLIVSFTLKEYQGPYFTNFQYDPSYPYLISSLNLAQLSGYDISHIDHPGTPVQVIGAAVISAVYFLRKQKDEFAEDVLYNPEEYLSDIDYTLIFINCIGLFVLGLISFRVYSDIFISLLFQLFPFTSVSLLSLLNYIRPENFLIFVVSIYISAILLFLNEKNMNARKVIKHLAWIGIISGLGIAAKLTFLPLILIPLILFRGFKFRALFLAITGASFLVFVAPAITFNNINYFYHWVLNIFIYTKRYGKGEPTFVEPLSFLSNIKKIVLKESVYDLAYFSVCASLLICLAAKYKNVFVKTKNNFVSTVISNFSKFNSTFVNGNSLKLSLGFLLAMTLQVLIVAKHYGENYMFPLLTFSVFAIFISISILSNSFIMDLTKKGMNIIYGCIILLITLYGTISYFNYAGHLKFVTGESEKLLEYVQENSFNSIVTSAVHIPSREFALQWGINYAAGSQLRNYSSILNSRYPTSIVYLKFKCHSFSDDTSSIKNVLISKKNILFVCSDENFIKEFLDILQLEYGITVISSVKKYSNENGEMVYEIDFKH